jgi:hypothetical protein
MSTDHTLKRKDTKVPIELNRQKAINERIHCPYGSLLAKQYNTTTLQIIYCAFNKKPAEAGLVVSVTRYFLP